MEAATQVGDDVVDVETPERWWCVRHAATFPRRRSALVPARHWSRPQSSSRAGP